MMSSLYPRNSTKIVKAFELGTVCKASVVSQEPSNDLLLHVTETLNAFVSWHPMQLPATLCNCVPHPPLKTSA
jgi:hypothetical protein